MNLKKQTKSLINKLLYIKRLYQNSQNYVDFTRNSCFPTGHYYSPIVSVDDIKKRELEIWNKATKDGMPGIDLRKDEQIKLIDSF